MTWTLQILFVPLGWIYATAAEWTIHRYLFHGLGRHWRPLGFHLHQHHRAVLAHGGADPSYSGSILAWNAHGREFWGLVAAGLLQLPLLFLAPGFYLAAMAGGLNYARVHRRAHLDPAWCRAHLPWHWDHHMGRRPDANWCVTSDWLDRLVGTRVYGPGARP